ncbi:prolipoprotein diacylglyceryl transferase [Gudongella sp. DL1XJH-153]|jgi:phosphatidylglycerol:prolipoprotein diacylglycerol transferase|uniref:prolipoprotein diacylglyceryl transferase n=1 Tax=Gudongella sp. DL1XJH-153 TaxID=3409804 RepID=UPI003BB5EE96
MKTIFSFGHYSMNAFGMFIGLGIVLGVLVAIKEAKRKKYSTDAITDLMMYAVIFGIVGARLYYVLVFNLEYYLTNPGKIIAVWDGGLSIQGALIGGALVSLIYARVKKINLWRAADIMAPGIILGQAIGRVGCDVFGYAMKNEYFWGIFRNGQVLHPTQMYESMLNFILFGVIWARRKSVKYDGQLFFTYLIGFSINRFIVEFFRTNPIFIEPFTVAHATSIGLILISFISLKLLSTRYKDNEEVEDKKYSISTKEVLLILVMMIASILIYYNWIWS